MIRVNARHRRGKCWNGASVLTAALASNGQCHPGWLNQRARTGRAASTRSSGCELTLKRYF